ncbi:CAP domain-containing protein [Carboxylicivirga sp. N1Y90]|uniref:CAP domain-containing protein n=1 Tax=Carboxylicivirga fragile TaxID=3417571 RepID=UPI003D3551EB|nr:hypothetical protein [Marinilabiliaceae bacterium N1Y90]
MMYLRKLCVLIALLLLTSLSFGQTELFSTYKQLNDEETRLPQFKDSDELLKLKLAQVDNINRSRRKYRVQTVRLDILASRVANRMAHEAALNKYMGHWNMAGEKPYIRFANDGGVHHMVENASSISSEGQLPMEPNNISAYMQECHLAFMAERKPNDGHKQNCIDPFHTHVGIGVAWDGGEFRYYENFLDVYLNFGHIKQETYVGDEIKLSFKMDTDNYHLYSIVVYSEEFPRPMSPRKISRLHSYSDYTETTFLQLAPWELPQKDSDGFYHLNFRPEKKGYYYCQIFLSKKPYKNGTASTKGKLQASGLVFKVN